jgi:CheY-like chemotaxis protein
MDSAPLLPYFHPTTVVVVDDNRMFLHTLDLRMPAEMAYVLHNDPRAALALVNRKMDLPAIPDRCIRRDRVTMGRTFELDLSLIEQEIKQTERFKRVAVVIVDYAMPQMNGLEFCARIEDPAVKKVMLTGVADEKVAVKAFNEGLIDRFVPKNGNTTLDLAIAFAQDLQHTYFIDQQRALQQSMCLESPSFLADRAVRRCFNELRQHSHCVEYYLMNDPTGFLMLTAAGDMSLLMIMDDADISRGIEFATSCGAPQDVLADLRERRKVGYFFDQPDDYEAGVFRWREYLHHLTPIRGDRDWWIALVPAPPSDIDFDARESSYQTYLDMMDRTS